MRKTYPTLQLMDSIAEAEAHNASSFSRNALSRECVSEIFRVILRRAHEYTVKGSSYWAAVGPMRNACDYDLIKDVSSWIETIDEPVKYDR